MIWRYWTCRLSPLFDMICDGKSSLGCDGLAEMAEAVSTLFLRWAAIRVRYPHARRILPPILSRRCGGLFPTRSDCIPRLPSRLHHARWSLHRAEQGTGRRAPACIYKGL